MRDRERDLEPLSCGTRLSTSHNILVTVIFRLFEEGMACDMACMVPRDIISSICGDVKT